MRRSYFLLFAFLLAAFPLRAGERHQSYISYETGDVVIVQQEDGRAVDARLNLPVYPGDEVRTQRRGRVEIRLSDGNVFAIERGAIVRFDSILDSYDGDSEGTVAQLRSGEVMIQRLSTDSSPLRLDTDVASYVATGDAVYGVETGGRGQDTISVYDGSVEVRTARRTSRLRSGDRATVDRDGIGAALTISRYGMSDFEEWILHRWERTSRNSRYLDSRFSYAGSDLDYYGGWVYVNSYNSWAWRPRVDTGWRPYHYGSWSYGPSGCLVWVSDEPWGWVPYHYGRWAWAGGFGWVWVPGATYSPAWVYWAFGPSYLGWVPAGWYDCWGPYYNWAYRPYAHVHTDVGFGFYGRVHLGRVDVNQWTFVDPHTVVSRRTDRTSLTTDQIRNRLARNGDQATVASGAIRLGRNEWKDPVSAVGTISRRGIGGGTGKEGSGTTTDLTPFFRRDPELTSNVRDHVTRIAGGGTSGNPAVSQRGGTSAVPSSPSSTDLGGTIRRDRGTVENPDVGGRAGIPRGANADNGRLSRPSGDSGRTGTGTIPRVTPDTPRVNPRDTSPGEAPTPNLGNRDRHNSATNDWRSRGGDRTVSPDAPRITPRGTATNDRPRSSSGNGSLRSRTIDRGHDNGVAPAAPVQSVPRSESWRGRSGSDGGSVGRGNSSSGSRDDSKRSIDIPRRIIDQIGGARVVPSNRSNERGSVSRDRGTTQTPRPTSVDRPAPSQRQPESRPSPPPNRSSDGGRAKIKPQ